MITNLILHVTNFITHTIDIWGYFGVLVLMAIESSAIPLPSEIIMPFAGFLVVSGRFSLLGLGIAGGVGSVFGSLLTYTIGRFGGRPLIEKYGRYVLFSNHDLQLAEKFFKRFGSTSTFIARMVPGIRTFVSIVAGLGEEPLLPFIFAAFLGSFIWSYFLAWLGFRLGENWHTLEVYFRKFDFIIVIIVVAGIAFWIYRHVKSLKS